MNNNKPRFNHLAKGIPNTQENRDRVKQLNKQAKLSNSKHRIAIKYRKPKENCKWGWGGTLSCEDAQEFAIYVRDKTPWSEREENKRYRELNLKYRALLHKYNSRELKDIVAGLLGNVEELSYALERGEDWSSVYNYLNSLNTHLTNNLNEMEK